MLLSKYYDLINSKNNNGITPLMNSCNNDIDKDSIKILIENKANVNLKDGKNRTALSTLRKLASKLSLYPSTYDKSGWVYDFLATCLT